MYLHHTVQKQITEQSKLSRRREAICLIKFPHQLSQCSCCCHGINHLSKLESCATSACNTQQQNSSKRQTLEQFGRIPEAIQAEAGNIIWATWQEKTLSAMICTAQIDKQIQFVSEWHCGTVHCSALLNNYFITALIIQSMSQAQHSSYNH